MYIYVCISTYIYIYRCIDSSFFGSVPTRKSAAAAKPGCSDSSENCGWVNLTRKPALTLQRACAQSIVVYTQFLFGKSFILYNLHHKS